MEEMQTAACKTGGDPQLIWGNQWIGLLCHNRCLVPAWRESCSPPAVIHLETSLNVLVGHNGSQRPVRGKHVCQPFMSHTCMRAHTRPLQVSITSALENGELERGKGKRTIRDSRRAQTNQLWMILLRGVSEQLLTPPAFSGSFSLCRNWKMVQM